MREAVLLCDYELLKILRHREPREQLLIGQRFCPALLRVPTEEDGYEADADKLLPSVFSASLRSDAVVAVSFEPLLCAGGQILLTLSGVETRILRLQVSATYAG
jgi:hypothetical protein